MVSVESIRQSMDKFDGSEDPEAIPADGSGYTPKPEIKARDVNLMQADDDVARVRDSMSELLPAGQNDEQPGLPTILQNQDRIKYTDNDARDYATTPIEPVVGKEGQRDSQAEPTPMSIAQQEAHIQSQ